MTKVFFLFLFLLAVAGGALAGTTGKIKGTVTDSQTNEPLVGVNVVVRGTPYGAVSDFEGTVFILNIPPGVYTVTFSSVGYQSVTVENVKISIDQTTPISVSLREQAIEGNEVVIVAERPVIRKDMTSVEARVDADAIKNLPVQEIHEVLGLQAGVTVDRGGGIHIRGGRTSEVAYWVDGKSVSDVFDGSQSIPVENSAVQELQVISGTFNAEYGNAMSGIVNIVTKDGGNEYKGNIIMYAGDYLSSDAEIFRHIDDFNLLATRNVEGSISGPVPVFGDIVTFYLFGRHYKTDGWLYGIQKFLPNGAKGSGNPAAMNHRERNSATAKLTFQVLPTMKFSLSGIGNAQDYRDYNHFFRLEPDGDVSKHERSYDLSGLFTHLLSSETFYTINMSKFQKSFREYLFENPRDKRYLSPDSLVQPAYSFSDGGTNLHHFNRRTTTYLLKIDFTTQLTKLHQVKFGAEAKNHTLFFDDFNIVPKVNALGEQVIPFEPDVLDSRTPYHDNYTREPSEFSVYAQDKIEYENMIINLGLRFDYFDPNGQILADPEDPNIYLPFKDKNKFDVNGDGVIDLSDNQALDVAVAKRRPYWYKDASKKSQISPRFGIAYPITDKGVIHFSYGHFLQIPSFSQLYQKPEYKITTSGGMQGIFGNADLRAQRTVMYEIGLQQQLTELISGDVTGFYRDIRDWVSTGSPVEVQAGTSYVSFVNKDYANVRGITLSLNKRPSDYYSFNISYSFQVAEGVNSSPEEEFFNSQSNGDPARVLSALDWDQTHTANLTLGLGDSDFGAFLIARYSSGLPYTPSILVQTRVGQNVSTSLMKNSRRRPDVYNLDIRVFKNLQIFGAQLSIFAKVLNVLDIRNELEVYGDTGRADKTLQTIIYGDTQLQNNTVAEWFNNPTFYSEPREIQIGFELGF
ncbi:MAG: TonB-dependent receptor [Bacteroidota bacterium]